MTDDVENGWVATQVRAGESVEVKMFFVSEVHNGAAWPSANSRGTASEDGLCSHDKVNK